MDFDEAERRVVEFGAGATTDVVNLAARGYRAEQEAEQDVTALGHMAHAVASGAVDTGSTLAGAVGHDLENQLVMMNPAGAVLNAGIHTYNAGRSAVDAGTHAASDLWSWIAD